MVRKAVSVMEQRQEFGVLKYQNSPGGQDLADCAFGPNGASSFRWGNGSIIVFNEIMLRCHAKQNV